MYARNAAIAWGFVVVWAGGLAAQEEGPAQATIQIAASAEVGADSVYLGDVAQIVRASSAAYAEALRGVYVAPAPLPGGERSVSLGLIRRYVIGRRDLRGELTWTGETFCRLVRKALPPALPTPGSPQQRAEPPRLAPSGSPDGAGVGTPPGEPVADSGPGAAAATPSLVAVIAARDLERGAILASGDVVLAEVPATAETPFTSPEQVVGLRVRQMVRAGSVLRPEATERVPDVSRGAPITVVIERGALRVSAQGVAEQAGFIGDVIPVRLQVEGRRRVVEAEVVSASTVRLP